MTRCVKYPMHYLSTKILFFLITFINLRKSPQSNDERETFEELNDFKSPTICQCSKDRQQGRFFTSCSFLVLLFFFSFGSIGTVSCVFNCARCQKFVRNY